MSQWKRIEQQLNNFILFGGMMTADIRRQTAELFFRYLYDPAYPALERLQQTSIPHQYPNWARLLEQLLQREDLRDIARNNEDLAFSLARETLEWAKRTYLQFETSHRHVQEEHDLQEFETQGRELSLDRWQEQLEQLKRAYPSYQRNWAFYQKTLAELD